MPGCGKTSLVNKALEKFNTESGLILTLNAMNFQKPVDLFLHILNEMKRDNSNKKKGNNNHPNVSETENSKLSIQEIIEELKSKKFKRNTLIVLDEIDSLFQMASEAASRDLFNLFTIPAVAVSQISLIGISNSMDLIIRLSEKHKANIGNRENIVFEPYKSDAMQDIIKTRIIEFKRMHDLDKNDTDFLESVFAPEAIRFCTNKLSKLKGGDIRCVFQALQDALRKKINDIESTPTPVEIGDFQDVIRDFGFFKNIY